MSINTRFYTPLPGNGYRASDVIKLKGSRPKTLESVREGRLKAAIRRIGMAK